MADKWDERKKAQEDEYFVKKEKELVEKLKAKKQETEKQSFKETCHMRCPKCGESLKQETFQTILVDQCTGCGGIWLDAGEIQALAGRESGSWLNKLWQRAEK